MASRPPSGDEIETGLLKLLAGMVILGLLTYFLVRGGNFARMVRKQSQLADAQYTATLLARCGKPSLSNRPIVVEMIYSQDARQWIEWAGDRFARQCSNIQVKLTAMEDFTAIDGLVSGQLRPTIWSPADDLSLSYMVHREHRSEPLPPWNPQDKVDLISSPLVWLIWEDRQRVLAHLWQAPKVPVGMWAETLCPLIPRNPEEAELPLQEMVPGSWSDWVGLPPASSPSGKPARKGVPVHSELSIASTTALPSAEAISSWGQVKIGYPRPTRHSAGAATLLLMAQDYLTPLAPRLDGASALGTEPTPAPELEGRLALHGESLRRWLRRCEAGIASPRPSEQALVDAMFHLGPRHFDAVVTYEQVALALLERIDAHAGSLPKLTVIYPRPTLIARHPAVLFSSPPEQREAAQRWLAFLRSPLAQEKALELGFRPALATRPLLDSAVEQNLFLRLRRYGVQPEPHLTEAARPSGKSLERLLALWAAATGRD